MNARLIDGRALAGELRARVTAQAARLISEHGITPGVAVILVGVTARISDTGTAGVNGKLEAHGPVLKAGKNSVVTSRDGSSIQ